MKRNSKKHLNENRNFDDDDVDDDDNDYDQMVFIDRNEHDKVWQSAFETFSKDTFDVASFVKVTFIGEDGEYEEALDGGGPTREFFRILMDAIRYNNCIFSGPEEERYLRMDRQGKLSSVFGDCLVRISLFSVFT